MMRVPKVYGAVIEDRRILLHRSEWATVRQVYGSDTASENSTNVVSSGFSGVEA